MKLNQIARLTPDTTTQYAELKALGFNAAPAEDLTTLVQSDLPLLFPEAYSAAAKREALANIAIDETHTLRDLVEAPAQWLNATTFYAAALQLLGFEPFTDYQLSDPASFMAATQLPAVETIATSADFLQALYLLLTTRTKHLVNYLDDLANRGFFAHYQDGKETPTYLFFNGKAQAVFDPRKLVREVVWVESDLDTDHDGQRDLLETTIFRPAATDQGVKMPVLFTANPYFHGTNDEAVKAITHVPDPHLAVKTVSHTKADVTATPAEPVTLPHKAIEQTSTIAEVYADEQGIYSLNDFFLSRGFVTVYSAGVGTRGSDGLRTTGDPAETASAVAVIEWLTGKRPAFTTRDGHTAIKAWWCNGNVAMTGKSYLGTLSIAAATSGVEGLKTIISESAISSWYDYYRENGLVVAPGGFQGEDADVLAVDTYSRQKRTGDFLRVKPKWDQALAEIAAGQDRTTGDYNAWWDARNYRNNLANITCDVVSVHGLNDWNVKPKNVIKLWQGLQALPIAHKLFLHQGQHVYLNNVLSLDFTDQMNLWLSYELLGVENGAKDVIPDLTVQDNVTPQTWHHYSDFGAPAADHPVQSLTLDQATGRGASFVDDATAIFTAHHQTSDDFEAEIVRPGKNSLYNDVRLWLDLPAFGNEVTLEGIPTLKLRLWIDQPTAIISARLVDVGDAKRFTPNASVIEASGYQLGYDFKADRIVEFGEGTESASKLITFGHVNAQNPTNAYEIQQIEPGKPFTVDFELQPTHYRLPKDRHLALIIHGADMAQTQRPTTITNYHIDLQASILHLPLRTDEH
ncbi:Xaa-Pro dipeptidyl-peptidase [Lacticaseibacillus mingshuiensis]|uniref:Xaa-Pro dipeptidyl-peptidase n=1 Tax=Lacticaseibacillus mingshuiensis TaxID=2799574 RepID=A0ABW4CIU6_9LACO|nr:Xaa-Pro dipeptidyl-peptidase [Lacticaseibacillus mingshuiensis]